MNPPAKPKRVRAAVRAALATLPTCLECGAVATRVSYGGQRCWDLCDACSAANKQRGDEDLAWGPAARILLAAVSK